MADFSIHGDTSIDGSGMQQGLSALTVAAGNLISGLVTELVQVTQQAIGAAYELGTAYETSLAKVSSIAGKSADDLADYSDKVLQLSGSTGQAAADINEAVYNVISATGSSAADALNIAADAEKLATAGFTNMGSAISAITTAMNSYGMGVDAVSHISDSLIATQNLGVTTVDALAGSMGKAIATASAYGVGLENLESGYVSLTKSGISTDESTTYLAYMFKELGDTGSAVGKTLREKTGKSFGELMASGQSLGDVIGILSDSVNGNSEALINLWGSAEAGKAANAIVSQGLDTFNENLETITASTGTTADAYATMTDTMAYQTGRLKTSAENMGILFYQSLEDSLTPIVGWAGDCVEQMTSGLQENGIAGMAAAGRDILSSLVDSFTQKAPDLIASGTEAVVSFITGLRDSLPAMLEQGAGLVQSIAGAVIENLPTLAQAAADTAISLIDNLAAGLTESIPTFLEQALPMLEGFTANLRENAGLLVDAGLNLITNLVQGLINALPDLLAYAPQIVINLANVINDNAPKVLLTAVKLIWMLIKGLVQAIPDLVAAAPKIVEAIVAVIFAFNWLNLGKTVIAAFKNGIEAMVGLVKSAGGKVFDGLKTPIAQLPSTLLNLAKNAVTNLSHAFTSINWGSIGSNIIQGIANGIGSAVSGLIAAAASAALSAFNAAKHALGIKSPSRKFRDEVGAQIPAGMAVGIEDNADEAVDAARQNAEDMVSAAQQAVFANNLKTGDSITNTGITAQTTLSASWQGESTTIITMDGREVARATAPYMDEQLDV